MRSGHWLGSALDVTFLALKLMVSQQSGHLASKKNNSTNPHKFSSGTVEGLEGDRLIEAHLKQTADKQ